MYTEFSCGNPAESSSLEDSEGDSKIIFRLFSEKSVVMVIGGWKCFRAATIGGIVISDVDISATDDPCTRDIDEFSRATCTPSSGDARCK
jgi:hypothetical protein